MASLTRAQALSINTARWTIRDVLDLVERHGYTFHRPTGEDATRDLVNWLRYADNNLKVVAS